MTKKAKASFGAKIPAEDLGLKRNIVTPQHELERNWREEEGLPFSERGLQFKELG